ncbi:hypothetical protein C4D60_Mb07t27560 [Musa balbisiana]|uniref:carnosine N-methyltransferase n=1 Tax=Musa balbisiana TaxID=52838 RepID=A0A4V4H6Z6_MUSBA|nr:hypothetical protein C4D60_Mb07t27560 [Musa balbisiana]
MDRRQHEEEVQVDEAAAAAAATTGQRRYSKLEEALEIKSLRRIISAYLNYPDAAEEDIVRYERSFRKLPPSHKALLSHLPLKYKTLRRCVSVNTYFIMSMLQAFDPPLDMSQDIDIDDHEDLQNVCESHQAEGSKCSVEKNVFSEQPLPIGGSDAYVSEPINSGEENNLTYESLEETTKEEEIHMEVSHASHVEKFVSSEKQNRSCNGNINDVKVVTDPAACCSNPDASIRATHLAHTWMDPSVQLNVPLVDVDKVRCIIRNIVRDWAAEGQKERDECYKPILEELNCLFPHRSQKRPPCCLVPGAGLGRLALEISCLGFVSQGNEFSYYMMICSSFILNYTQVVGEWTIYPWIHSNCNSLSDSDQLRSVSFPDIHPSRPPCCLVPGAGLGRLALEISCLGFVSQGNEFSYYMMICSSFILNYTQVVGEWTIYPWIHSNCNSLSDSDQLRSVSFPDIHPSSAGITEGFSMCAGDFVEVYNDESQEAYWDAVVTCFFLDTAHNIVEYIETISKLLKTGGVWINLGPLLYHFADSYGPEDEMSIELSLEDVKKIAFHFGFVMENRYCAAFWTMRKSQ